MPRVKLTDRFVAGLKTSVRTSYFDTKAAGLALRVTPKGVKTWAFVYRLGGRGPQWLTLGTYPAMGLADARTAALDHRHSVDVEGRNPREEEKAERAAIVAADWTPAPDRTGTAVGPQGDPAQTAT